MLERRGSDSPAVVTDDVAGRSLRRIVPAILLAPLLVGTHASNAAAQETPATRWIRPADARSPAVWGIRGGIVFSLWPDDVETGWPASRVRPRGLIRIGYERNGLIYLINFVAVEPVVGGKMEFSEISPSRVDGQWGKLMWAGDSSEPGRYFPGAITRGTINRPVTFRVWMSCRCTCSWSRS